MKKRTLAIGDIHGCLDALTTLEELVGFCESDTIITLGDYIDRGPDSKGVIDWMLSRRKKYNLIPLLGNHEELMVDSKEYGEAHYFWIMNGGGQTLKSFNCDIDGIPDKYWEFISDCELYHETDDHIFVHAGLEPGAPPELQKSDVLCWLRFRDLKPHMSNKTIVCGHTPQDNEMPGVLPYGICIDTHAFHPEKGYLTCLHVETGEYWQANSKGDTRSSKLEKVIQ